MRRTVPLLITLVALSAAAASASAHTARARSAPSMVATINDARADRGCAPLHVHAGLTRAAGRQARLLLADGELDHDAGSPFAERLEQAAPDAHVVAENLAWASGADARPDAIFVSWMQSPEHRAIMLDCEFTQVGIGIASGQFGDQATGSVYTADFAA
jgi:uncharacterized protein YkwD